jgi:hypothetical protein
VLWELAFMLVVLKIPVVYLCAVVWWAIKAEPRPLAGAQLPAAPGRPPSCDWDRRRRRPAPSRGGRGGGRGGRVVGARRVVSSARARSAVSA